MPNIDLFLNFRLHLNRIANLLGFYHFSMYLSCIQSPKYIEASVEAVEQKDIFPCFPNCP